MTAAKPAGRSRSWVRRAGLLYLALLAASYVAWWIRPGEPEPPATESARDSACFVDVGQGPVRVTYLHYGTNDSGLPTVLLLHGTPGRKEHLEGLASALKEDYRVIVPDLPGFGRSEPSVPDYSARAHALYVLALLEALDVRAVHVLGFSMGGAVAIELAEMAPDRVRSVCLLASIGVQELELFGSHRLNHALHGLQLGLVQTLRFASPHFGALDGLAPAHAYARNFFDTDQRPLRGMLGQFEAPMLILHGEHDFLVPLAAAREHERIVPQSELEVFDASHFLPWSRPTEIGARFDDFVTRVEAGEALGRDAASAARMERAREPFDPAVVPALAGAALLVTMLLLAVATFASEDLTCIAAGLLVAQGRIGFLAATLACFLGIFIGDVLLFLAGRMLGAPALRRAPLRWFVSPASVERAGQWFARRGGCVIFLSRFIPGLRLPTYVAAGMLRMNLGLFSFYFILAGVLWTPLLVGFAGWAGLEIEQSTELFERYALAAFAVLAVGLLALERLVIPLFSFRGRRALVGSLRRKVRWEFWPPFVFYVPVALCVAWLALRHRSLALVTAVNPGIPGGGFIGESKAEILGRLAGSGHVARFLLLPAASAPAQRVERARTFLAAESLTFPVVLKPDVGQRGSGVHVVRDADELDRLIADLAVDSIVQEFVSGPEFGVFYVRSPGAARGRIFSITEKRLPVLEGDGTSTLEELILRDDRAVCAARTYFAANAARLSEVPVRGSEVQLVDLGTHCRGAIFLDGGALRTPELERAIDDVSRHFDGFFFGRYDLRVPSIEDLRAGRGFKILELNGLTSEATHIYDPKVGLVTAYGVLFEQWRTAFEIARENRTRGAAPARLRELVRGLRDYRRLQARH